VVAKGALLMPEPGEAVGRLTHDGRKRGQAAIEAAQRDQAAGVEIRGRRVGKGRRRSWRSGMRQADASRDRGDSSAPRTPPAGT